jgi:anaerobic selenocysteine-containing dehydrogenase
MRAGCPTGALMPANLLDKTQKRTGYADRQVESVCPYCGVGCQITYNIKDDKLLFVEGRNGPSNQQRLCVKGRFGFDYVSHPHRLTKPLIRKSGVPKSADDQVDPANPWTHFREATWDEALDLAAGGLKKNPRPRRAEGAGRLRLGQGLERGGLSLPEAGAHGLRLQQRRSLHAAVPRLVGRGADGGVELRCA